MLGPPLNLVPDEIISVAPLSQPVYEPAMMCCYFNQFGRCRSGLDLEMKRRLNPLFPVFFLSVPLLLLF